MSKDQIKRAIGFSLWGASLLFLFLWQRPNPPVDRPTQEAIGTLMGQQALSLMSGSGRLLVIMRDNRTVRNPAAEIQFEAFKKAIAGKAKIALTNLVSLDAIRVPLAPAGDLYRMMRSCSESDLIVSFLGFPHFPETPQYNLPGKPPKVLALCTGAATKQVALGPLFKRGLLTAAVIDKEGAARAAVAPAEPQAIFNQFYTLTTASTWSASSANPAP